MGKPVFYLAVVVLLRTASECYGLEWEFGSNLSGSQTTLEKEGIIPYYVEEKRVHVAKPKCMDVIYVKIEVEDMPTVTYNIELGMVVIKFEKGRRAKNSVFRVTAKGVPSESVKCGGTTTPMGPTGYPEGENPFHDGTPYFQFSNEYLPTDASPNDAHPNNEFHNDAPSNDEFFNDAHPNNDFHNNAPPNNEFRHDAHPNNEFQNDAHTNNEYQNDAHPNKEFRNDAPPNNEFHNDVPPNNKYHNDAPPNYEFSHDAHPNNEFHNDAPPNNEFSNDAHPDDAPLYDV